MSSSAFACQAVNSGSILILNLNQVLQELFLRAEPKITHEHTGCDLKTIAAKKIVFSCENPTVFHVKLLYLKNIFPGVVSVPEMGSHDKFYSLSGIYLHPVFSPFVHGLGFV